MHAYNFPSTLSTIHDFPRWRRKDTVLAFGSGLLIRRQGAVFRPNYNTGQFLSEASGVKQLPWCWHFTNWDRHLETAHGWIQGPLKSLIRGAFLHVTVFEFHLWRTQPPIPDWLDAEYLPDLHALALYGDKEVRS